MPNCTKTLICRKQEVLNLYHLNSNDSATSYSSFIVDDVGNCVVKCCFSPLLLHDLRESNLVPFIKGSCRGFNSTRFARISFTA